MKTKLRFAFLAFTMLFSLNAIKAQVQVGSGTDVNQSIPVEPFYGYTYSQSIFTNAEINATGAITGVRFYATASTTLANSSDWTVYIGHTTKTEFTSGTDWIDVNTLTQVFSGTATIAGGEVLITFSTPFNYNGTDNLVIAVDENLAGYDGSGDDFYCTATSNVRSLSYRNDATNPDPFAPPAATFQRNYIPNVELQGISSTCELATNIDAVNLTTTTADIQWTDNTGGSAVNYEIEVVPSGSTPSGIATDNGMSPVTVSGLTSSTTYDYYIRTDCGSGDFSSWAGPFSFSTTCSVFSAPYVESFNIGVLPLCWDNNSSNSVANGLWKFTGTPDYGANANGKTAGTYAWSDGSTPEVADITLTSPEVDLTPLTDPLLRFEWFSNNTTNPGDNVPLIVEINDGGGWTNLTTLSGDFATWQEESISLTAYAGQTVQVRFITDQTVTTTSAYYNDILFDEFQLIETPTCIAPSTLTASNIMATSADLGWTENNGAMEWEVVTGAPGFTPSPSGSTTTSNPENVTGLTSSTDYEFYVRTICGVGDTSIWEGPFAFSTPCNPFTATYTQNFDGAPAVIPFAGIDCWSITGQGQVDINLVDATDDGEPIPSGPNAVELNDGNLSSGDSAILVSPVFSDLSTGLNRIRFMAHQENTSDNAFASLYIGVMSDPNDPNTFVMYDSITKAEFAASTGFNEHIVYFNNTALIGSNDRIAFMHGDDTYEVYIDDFVYEPNPSCIEPTNLTASNITGSSVELSWTDINSASPAGWNIEYGPSGFTQGTGTVEPATSSPHTITGLSDQTSYDFYIQTDCGGGDFSIWYGPISVTTPCNAFVAPYLQQFDIDALPNCWEENGDNNWEYGNDVTNPVGTAGYGAENIPEHSNNNGTFIFMDGSDNGNSEISYLYSPQIDVSALSTTEIRYYVFSNNVDDAAQNKLIVEYNNGSGWVALDSIQDNLGPDWSERVFYEPGLTGNLQVRFEITGDNSAGGSTYHNDILIDDFEVKEAPSCLPVIDLEVNNITETSAEVSWTAQGSATNWNIEYGPAGFTPGTGTTISTSNNPETLPGLIDNTDYDVYVQADCGGDTSITEGPVSFSTDIYCDEPVAFQITDSTATTVDLQWIAQGTEVSWDIVYGPSGFTPGSGAGTTVTVSTNPYTLTGLQAGTVYDYYIQANCGQGQNNPYAGPLTQATPITNDAACNAIPVPVDGSTTQYTNVGATLETGESTSLGDNSIWFTFTAPADGHLEIRTCGNDFDNYIEVYEEPTDCGDFNTYTLVDDATNNPFATCNGTFDPAGLILCGLTPGNTYYLAVGSETAGNTGIFPLTLTAIPNAEAGNGTVSQVCSGDMVNLSGALSGNDNGGVWSEIDITGGLEPNGVYNTTNLAYIDYEVEYRVTNECSYDSTIVTVSISGPSSAGQNGTMADCNVDRDYVLISALSGNVDFGGTWIDIDGTGKLNGGVFTPDSLAAGTYQFDYIVSNDVCPNDTSAVEVTITDCVGTEDLTAESFKIFPNPTNGIFYLVSTVNANNAVVEITDLQGKVISSEQMNLNIGSQYDFNLSQLERGVYLIRVATEENTTVKRVVLQR